MKTITFDETKWKLVPVEPTPEMKAAGINIEVYSEVSDSIGALTWAEVDAIYRAMLAATPAAPSQEPGKCAQCKKPYRKGANTEGCPKCAPGVVVPESEFQKPISSQEPAPTGCNCRWDGDTQVQWCELHLAHKDAIHEWAERAKTAEAKLAQLSTSQKPVTLTDEDIDNLARKHAGDPSCSGAWGSSYEFDPSELRAFVNEIAALREKQGGV